MMDYIMDKNFEIFYHDEGFGPCVYSAPVSLEVLNKYKNKLPNQLLEYWKAFGFSAWGAGLFWLVNPDDYQDVLHAWLEHIHLPADEEYFVIARSAFGDLSVWGTVHGRCLTIAANTAQVFASMDEMEKYDADVLMQIFISSQDKDALDMHDWKNQPLFNRAVKTYGTLNQHEMFGFDPTLTLTAEVKFENLRKLPIISHLQFLAALERPNLMLDLDIVEYVDQQALGQDDRWY